MQDGFVFFSQKTTRVSFDQRFLSFLMGFAGQRYDFNRTMNRTRHRLWHRHYNVRRAYTARAGEHRTGNFLLPWMGVVCYNTSRIFMK